MGAGQTPNHMITALIIAVVVLGLGLMKPRYGAMAVIMLWPMYLWRTKIAGIPTTVLELSIYALVVAAAVDILRRRSDWRNLLPSRPWLVLALAWVVAWIIASVNAADKQAALGAFKAWLVDPLLFIAAIRVACRNADDRRWLAAAATVSGVIVSLAGLAQMIWFRETLQDGRLSSFFHPVANFAAMFLAPVAVLTWSRLLHRDVRGWLWWAAAIVITAALVLTVSFGGLMSLGAGLVIAWLFLPPGKIKMRLALVAIVIGAAGFFGLYSTHYFAEHFQPGRSSGQVRHQIWTTTIRIIREHPITGVGPNNFEPAYRTTVPILFWPPLEWEVSKAHNLYLNLWAETGILGLLAFAAIIIFLARGYAYTLRDPARRAITIAAAAAVLAILVHGLVDTPYFKNDLSLEFALLAILPWL